MAKYNNMMVKRICELIESDDYPISEICRIVGLHKDTWYDWKNNKPEFSDAIKEANERRLDNFKVAARNGLMTLLNGKEWEEVTTEWISGKKMDEKGNPIPVIKSQKKVKKFIMPNPISVIFTLKNTDSDSFADIQKTDITTNGQSIVDSLRSLTTDERLTMLRLRKKMNNA